MNILEIENLSAAFPGKPVLHDINLSVSRCGRERQRQNRVGARHYAA